MCEKGLSQCAMPSLRKKGQAGKRTLPNDWVPHGAAMAPWMWPAFRPPQAEEEEDEEDEEKSASSSDSELLCLALEPFHFFLFG